MEDTVQKSELRELQRGRKELIEQIRLSQKTIEHSRELLKRIDELLAKGSQKKPRA
jgi:hypothetical protein